MREGREVRTLTLLCLRFIVIIPFALAGWWSVMPYYVHGLGAICAWMMRALFSQDVTGASIHSTGILNTAMVLKFLNGNGGREIEVSSIVTNVAPFVALILATPRISWGLRARALAVGLSILAAGHVAYLVLCYIYAEKIALHSEFPTAAAELYVTLPFLLWIVMAYWGRNARRNPGAAAAGPTS